MMSEIKPCPFCDGDANLFNGIELCCLRCSKCGGSGKWYACNEDAIAAWNRRVGNETTTDNI